MPDRHGTFSDHRRAAELHDAAAHAHRVAAEAHGKQDHLTGQELTRQALEHSHRAYLFTQQVHQTPAKEPDIAPPKP